MKTNFYENPQDIETLDRLQAKMDSYIRFYTSAIQKGSEQRAFSYGDQWDSEAANLASRNNITPLTQNDISKHIKELVAEFCNNFPTPTSQALSPKLDEKTVDAFSAVIDDAIKQNGFEEALSLAYEDALRTGCGGAIYLYSDYIHEDQFKQDVYFKYISYTEVFFDPYAQLPTKADGDFCGYIKRLPMDEFKVMYPDIDPDNVVSVSQPFCNYNQLSDTAQDNDKSVTLAHMFERSWEDKTLYLTSDGRTITDEKELNQDERIIKTRQSKQSVINSYIMDGVHILKKTRHPLHTLPIIYVSGMQTIIDNEIRPFSFGYDVFDIQKVKNWTLSQVANMMLNLRKENFVVDIKDLSQEEMRVFINPLLQQGCIPYHSNKNQPPQQLRPPELSETLLNLIGGTGKEIDNTLGRFEDVQGKSNADISGIARQLSISQNNISVYFYVRHAVAAVKQICQILAEFLPKIYVEERLIINGAQKVIVNPGRSYPDMESLVMADMTLSDLNVDVKVGASFEIQKQHYMEAMAQLIQKLPEPLNTVLLPNLLALYEIPNSADVNKKIEQVMKITNPTIGQIMEGISDEKLEEAMKQSQANMQQSQQLQQQMQQFELQAQQAKQQIAQAELALKAQQQKLEELKGLSDYQVDTERLDQQAQQMALTQQQNQQKTQAEITKAYLGMMKGSSSGIQQ